MQVLTFWMRCSLQRLAFAYATAREVSYFVQTQSQPRAQCFQTPERLRPNEHHLTATHETDRRAEAARLAQRHNEALAKKPADNPRFKPAANVPGQGFVIVGTKR
jgi:hypothetical protein